MLRQMGLALARRRKQRGETMAEIIGVANAAELYAALSSAQGGFRIELAPGGYGGGTVV